MNFYIGKIVAAVNPNETGMLQTSLEKKVPTKVVWRETELVIPQAEDKEFTELGTLLTADVARLRLVVGDVLAAIERGGKILVLSERVGHAESLWRALQSKLPEVKMVLVTGQMKQAQREKLLAEIKQNQYQVMVATGGVVGEGFDWPALDHLFLTFPFSWRGKLIQYVGRVQRVTAGKTRAWVYDYVDNKVGMFRAMQYKRRRAYAELVVQMGS
jgi:superfamily II DNA or RNA helicase